MDCNGCIPAQLGSGGSNQNSCLAVYVCSTERGVPDRTSRVGCALPLVPFRQANGAIPGSNNFLRFAIDMLVSYEFFIRFNLLAHLVILWIGVFTKYGSDIGSIEMKNHGAIDGRLDKQAHESCHKSKERDIAHE